MKETVTAEKVQAAVLQFVAWLERHGETSFDHQSYFASDLGRSAKACTIESLFWGYWRCRPYSLRGFRTLGRRLFWKPQRFPIADAHYAMGFAFLAQVLGQKSHLKHAVHFLEVLKENVVRASAITPGATHSTGKHATEPLKKGRP